MLRFLLERRCKCTDLTGLWSTILATQTVCISACELITARLVCVIGIITALCFFFYFLFHILLNLMCNANWKYQVLHDLRNYSMKHPMQWSSECVCITCEIITDENAQDPSAVWECLEIINVGNCYHVSGRLDHTWLSPIVLFCLRRVDMRLKISGMPLSSRRD